MKSASREAQKCSQRLEIPLPRGPTVVSEVLPPPWVQVWAQLGPQTALPLSPEADLFSFPSLSSQRAYSLPIFLPFPLLKTFCILASLGLGFKNAQRSLASDRRFEVIHVMYLLDVVATLGPGFVRFNQV